MSLQINCENSEYIFHRFFPLKDNIEYADSVNTVTYKSQLIPEYIGNKMHF